MLTWRAIARPATTLRQGSQVQRPFIHPSRFLHLQALPRPLNTLIAKIRFRADGKPRSKLMAVGFGTLILSNLLLLLALYNEDKRQEKLLSPHVSLILLQHTDSTYDSVNFDDPASNLSYFKKLYIPAFSLDSVTEAMTDRNLQAIEAIVDSKFSEVEIQQIMRLAADKVHAILQELERDSILNETLIMRLFYVIIEANRRLWSARLAAIIDRFKKDGEVLGE